MKFEDITSRIFRFIFLLLLIGATGKAYCSVPENPDEDFVIASVMIASPGEELYSKLGHAFLRMQCPSHGMDFCFTYESEDAARKVLSFLSGNLKMGMQGIKTPEFLQHYSEEGRGVTEYELKLPIAVKQNLWRILDNHVAEGMYLPYDYMERGCAYSVFNCIREALGEKEIQIADWPSDFDMTRREIVCSRLDTSPWTRLFLNVITNGPIDDDVPNTEKTITPETLVLALKNASVDDRPLLSEGREIMVEKAGVDEAAWLSPLKVAWLLLVLTLVGFIAGGNWMTYVMLSIQTLLGLFVCYLLFCSSLCATESSWLAIPFNPLPLLLWKWRKYWELPLAALLTAWCLLITFGGAYLMDPPLVLLAFTFSLSLVFDHLSRRGIRVDLKTLFSKLILVKSTNLKSI